MSDNPQERSHFFYRCSFSSEHAPSGHRDRRAGRAREPQQPEPEAYEPEEENAEATSEEEYAEDDEGEDAYEADDGEEYDEEPRGYTVKVDGQEVEVTLDELQNGYSRQQAYTKRSMELAEQRKAFEAEQAETRQIRDAYAQQLDQLAAQIQQTTQQEPDWRALAETMSERDLFLYKAEWDQQKEYQKCSGRAATDCGEVPRTGA